MCKSYVANLGVQSSELVVGKRGLLWRYVAGGEEIALVFVEEEESIDAAKSFQLLPHPFPRNVLL